MAECIAALECCCAVARNRRVVPAGPGGKARQGIAEHHFGRQLRVDVPGRECLGGHQMAFGTFHGFAQVSGNKMLLMGPDGVNDGRIVHRIPQYGLGRCSGESISRRGAELTVAGVTGFRGFRCAAGISVAGSRGAAHIHHRTAGVRCAVTGFALRQRIPFTQQIAGMPGGCLEDGVGIGSMAGEA